MNAITSVGSGDLRRKFSEIFGPQFNDARMSELLKKCHELGVTTIDDILLTEEKDFEGILKTVEVRKLLKCVGLQCEKSKKSDESVEKARETNIFIDSKGSMGNVEMKSNKVNLGGVHHH